ncbi:MAG: hypothetical protein GY845_03355 [Planctomycetes bacterium]|nr:hypothetical protein [Planctomycetota bacterium]
MPKKPTKTTKTDKSDTIDKIVNAVKNSKAAVDDSEEAIETIEAVEIDESLDSSSFVTKSELESFGDKLITTMSDLFKTQTDVHHDLAGQAPPIPHTEIGADTRGIEPVAANDMIEQADLEMFMNQILTVYIHPSSNKEDNPVLVPSVNGVNQPINRGQDSKVKRKFVEVLARNRHTGYTQIIDKFDPEKYIMSPDMVVKDPFTVRHDPDPRGVNWLQNILAEA